MRAWIDTLGVERVEPYVVVVASWGKHLNCPVGDGVGPVNPVSADHTESAKVS